jgi:DNA-binding transcriptional LysR family regulator
VAPVISHYTARYPQVSVEMTLNDRLVDLVEEGYDLAIRASIGDPRPSSLIARPIARLRLVLCAAPEYIARHGAPQAPEELANHNCLIFTSGPSAREWTFGAGEEQKRVAVSGNFLADNLDALRAAAIAGAGVAYLGTDIIGEDLASGRLVTLLPGTKQPDLGVFAVYPSRRHLSAKVRSFVDFLVERFAGNPIRP